LEPLPVANPSEYSVLGMPSALYWPPGAARSLSTIGSDKLYALDKCCGRAALSRFGGINAKADPGDTRCPIFVKISFERRIEVELDPPRVVGCFGRFVFGRTKF
jgi:hypothetical protein